MPVPAAELAARVARVRAELESLAALGIDDLPEQLDVEILAEAARCGRLVDAVTTTMTERVARDGEWARDGARSPAGWIAERTGTDRREVLAQLAAASLVATSPVFGEGLRRGRTPVAALATISRALLGHGRRRQRRRACFAPVAASFAALAATGSVAAVRDAVDTWCAQVDPLPVPGEDDAWSSRYLLFTEFGDEMLVEGRFPLPEGRLLRARCQALIDVHHRRPEQSPLDRRPEHHVANSAPSGMSPLRVVDSADTDRADTDPADTDRADTDPADPGSADADPADAGALSSESISPDEVTARTPHAALMADAWLHLADLAAAGPHAAPAVRATRAQLLIVVPGERLPALRAAMAGPPSGDPPIPPGSPPRDLVAPRGAAPPLVPAGAPGAPPPAAMLLGGARPVPLRDDTVARIGCGNAVLRRVVVDSEGIITELGRRVRLANHDQRVDMVLRDGVCRFPGCHVPAELCRAHHLVPFAEGGCTDVDEMASLCESHHHAVHEGGFRMTGSADGELVVHRPDGRRVGSTWPRPVPGSRPLPGTSLPGGQG